MKIEEIKQLFVTASIPDGTTLTSFCEVCAATFEMETICLSVTGYPRPIVETVGTRICPSCLEFGPASLAYQASVYRELAQSMAADRRELNELADDLEAEAALLEYTAEWDHQPDVVEYGEDGSASCIWT